MVNTRLVTSAVVVGLAGHVTSAVIAVAGLAGHVTSAVIAVAGLTGHVTSAVVAVITDRIDD